ncbi:MAG: hypothetical protein AABZ53_10020 [Planctomycetota bacterium]
MNARIAAVSSALTLAALAGSAHADTIYWNTNGPSTAWGNPANWIGGVVPGFSDFVVITPGAGPQITGFVVISGLYIQPGGGLVVLSQFNVNGGASIQGTMSIAGQPAHFYHRDDVNLEGRITLWSGGNVSRMNGGTGVLTVRPTGSIVVPNYDTSGVILGTAMQVDGLIDVQSTYPVNVGRWVSETSDNTYISINSGGTLRYSHSGSMTATAYPNQSSPYIVNAGTIDIEGLLSDVVNFSATLPVFNAGVLLVNQPDVHIRSSWDITPDGTLTRGQWACSSFGRVFFDNNTLNSVGAGALVYLTGYGSTISGLGNARENAGTIILDNTASMYFAPPGGTFTNHGRIQIGERSTLSTLNQFYNAHDATIDCWITGSTPGSYGTINAGTAALAGTFNAYFGAGYLNPSTGDILQVVSSGSWLSGQFETVNILNTPASVRTEYDVNAARLVVGCPADFDGDASVDFFDYDAFVNCFEGNACPAAKTADFDGDGTVDFFDYDAFVVAFETPC